MPDSDDDSEDEGGDEAGSGSGTLEPAVIIAVDTLKFVSPRIKVKFGAFPDDKWDEWIPVDDARIEQATIGT